MTIPCAGELRKMNGRKVRATNRNCTFEGYILVNGRSVYIGTDDEKGNGGNTYIGTYKYSWCIIYNEDDSYITDELFSLEFLDDIEPKNDMPVVGQQYEFSNDGKEWKIRTLKYFVVNKIYSLDNLCYMYVRPVQTPPKESEAVEYLKSLGYNVTK